jgi:pentatricopeptide repeat protein
MEAVGVRGDSIIYSMLIRVCKKGGEWQKAREFKQRMADER